MATPCRACAYLLLLLLVLTGCLLHQGAAAQFRRPAGEAELLLQIKRGWGDPPVLAAWNATSASAAGAHCRWPFVGCDSDGRVTSLALAGINVTGPIPDAVGGLSSLTHLDISDNHMAGAFPTTLYRCRSLRYLNLSYNHIIGELPDDIGRGLGPDLSTLDLRRNEFTGSIPVSLSMLRNLRYLALAVNLFLGLARCATLQYLFLDSNQLSGEVPEALWTAGEQLAVAYLQNNRLTGSLPVTMPSKLTRLYIGSNQFVGRIPEVAVALEDFSAENNQFSGEIPASLADGMPLLKTLNLANNKLSGRIS